MATTLGQPMQYGKDQLSINERLAQKDQKRHKNFFDSLDKKQSSVNGIIGIFGALLIVAVAGVAGFVLTRDTSTNDVSVSSEDCGEFQVKVYTSDGFYCKDCHTGEYGRLEMCQEESANGVCVQSESGCFSPESN